LELYIMGMRSLTSAFSTKATPQSKPIPGRESEMVENSAGGYTFAVDCWARLGRFLILGSDGGSYYASAPKLTEDNANVVLDCLQTDARRTVDLIADISDGGRAPKNTPALFALAMACKLSPRDEDKAYAYKALPRVARIGTHLFDFAEAIKAFGGYTHGFQRAVGRWYLDFTGLVGRLEAVESLSGEGRTAALRELKGDFERLGATGRSYEDRLGKALGIARERAASRTAYQIAKYQSREGWSAGDLLRLAKPGDRKGPRRGYRGPGRGTPMDHIFGWARDQWVPGVEPAGDATDILWAFEQAKLIGLTGAPNRDRTGRIVKLITDYRLTREMIPTAYLNEVAVWEALLMAGRGMPIGAMIRNLPKMTAIGLIGPMSSAAGEVGRRLRDAELLRRARIHPLQVLVAMQTYRGGRGIRGSLTWSPNARIVDALDEAFHLAFKGVEPTGKRWLLALDISGSMTHGIANMPGVSCRMAAAAMAMVTARVESEHHIVAFSSSQGNAGWGRRRSVGAGHWAGPQTQFRHRWGNDDGLSPLAVSPRQRLDDVVESISKMPAGGTDCALPMIYAKDQKVPVDVFVVYTDNETWHGRTHPQQALDAYKQSMGIDSKLIVVGMVSNGFTIADPTRTDNLDIVGMDTTAPQVMGAFAKGDF
jgi:60 kDa SS-A/Ro ribonucleoprotein